ncbi:MAG: acyltransferase [Schwartzia sp.]|nr:acyltransferase [Schwartzia sp. (in: firmicutes)]
MTKPRLPAIEYIRGVSMLGVVGIHVGSQYLANPTPNVHLVALFEIATRFAVPIFFFISAFGLIYHLDMNAPFSYRDFLRRRARTVLVPYLVWSVFYILHYTVLYRDTMLLHPTRFLYYLFFGFASYQLYFMVILLWFYLLMPLWIWALRRMTLPAMAGLLVFQIVFDYWSSYLFNPYGLEPKLLRLLMVNRLNYWVLHYVFIFLLGGWLAIHFREFRAFMEKRGKAIAAFFAGTLAAILLQYYWLLAVRGYTPVEAINTAHQLSPAGVLYTMAASLFFFTLFTHPSFPGWLAAVLSFLGRHSYFVYLAHPLAITYLSRWMERRGFIMTGGRALAFYLAVVALTLLAAVLMRRLGERRPLINALTIGVYPREGTGLLPEKWQQRLNLIWEGHK